MKPLIAIPRWKAPTWERTGYYLDSLEMAGARCQLVDEKKLPKDAQGLLLMGGVDVNPKLYGENRGLDDLPLVGFDVVEVAPACDSAEITALLAANLVYEFLLVLAANR